MRSFFQECNKIFFDHIPCSWFNIYTDADEQAIKDFRTEALLSPSTADKQIFENLELFTDKGIAKNGAAMFFGKEPERKFPHAITRCVLFKGTTKVYIIDDKLFGGPLYQQYLQAMAWLESKLQVAYKIEGPGPREEIREIPLTVFVERVASGIPRMQEAMKEAKLPEPEFHTDGMFTVVFKRKYGIISDTVNEKEQEVLKLLRQQGGLNATEIAQKLGKSIPTVKRYLSSLSKLNLIEFRGAPKTGGYYIS